MPPTGERGDEATEIDRRTVIRAVGGAAAVGAFATGAAGDDDGDGADYAVAQGDECVPVVPLSGDDPVEDLYGLQIPDRYGGDNGAVDEDGPYYQSNGTTDLQAVNTTITFLYDGPDGLSLVVVHDKPGDEDGGSVSWTVRDVPGSAEWAVKDDLYQTDGEPADNNYDRWNTDGTTHQVDWTWGSAGTDGGALRGLDDAAITVDPAFNEQASLWGEHYAKDPITDWQVLSFPNGRDDPKRTSLDLDRPITIGAGGCDADATTGTGAGDRDEASDEPVEITIDVKPGSDRNPINPRSQGVVPVEIIGGNGVDPADVDIDTLRFGTADVVGANDDRNGGASPAHSGHTESIGDDDRIIVHFPAHRAGFDDDDEKAILVGKTEGEDEVLFYGHDKVTIVGGGDDRDEDQDGDRDDDDRHKNDDHEKDDDGDDDDDDHEKDDDGDDDDDDHGGPGRGKGKGNGNNGRGNGKGRGNGNGNGRGNGNGKGRDKGRGNGRGNGK